MLVPTPPRAAGGIVAERGELAIRVASESDCDAGGSWLRACVTEGSLSLTASAGAAAALVLVTATARGAGTNVAAESGCNTRPHWAQRLAPSAFAN